MKKTINLIFIFAALLITAGCATIHKTDSAKLKIIQASEIIAEPEKYQNIVSQYINEGKELVIFFKTGESIPLKMEMSFPVAHLETKSNNLVFSHDTYFLISHSKMRISPDGQKWADIYDIESQKKLFGFNKGEVSVGFQVTKKEGAVILLDVIAK